jgi:Sec-independent protein translocase protein TatA
MLAISSWAWTIIAAIILLSLGVLIRVTIGLISRLKDLTRTVSSASEQLQEALSEMQADLDQTNEGLAGMRRRAADDEAEPLGL